MARTRRTYPAEFQQQMIESVGTLRSPEALSRESEPSAQTIRNGVTQADLDGGRREGQGTADREELRKLRREMTGQTVESTLRV